MKQKTIFSKILAVLLTLVMVFSIINPIATDASTYWVGSSSYGWWADNTAALNEVKDLMAKQSNSYMNNRFNKILSEYPLTGYFNTYKTRGCAWHCGTCGTAQSSCLRSFYDDETGSTIALTATQCLGYARYCLYRFFKSIKGDKKITLPAGFSQAKLKDTMSTSIIGSHFRVGGIHSLVLLAYNDSNMYFIDANSGYGSSTGCVSGKCTNNTSHYSTECKINLRRFSYAELTNRYKSGGITIETTSTNYNTTTHTHSYERGYEAAHPHKVYMKCSCGDYYYTGETTTMDSCRTCNPIPGKPTLNVIATDESKLTGFTWNNISDADHYDLRVWRTSDDKNVLTVYTIQNTDYSYHLPAGDYYADVCSVAKNMDYTGSDRVNFTVKGMSTDFQPTNTAIFGNKIYAVFDNPISYEYAKMVSEKMGGHLASIHSEEEQKVIESLISNRNMAFWLGGSDNETEGIWKWEDGTLWDYDNWAPREPNNDATYYGNENYLEISSYTGLWNDVPYRYNFNYGFIAEFNIDDIKKCKSFQTQLNGHTYTLFEKCLPWEITETFCKNIHGHLATITSKEENDLLSSLATRGGKNCFIGGTDKNAEGIWQWIDTGEIFYHTSMHVWVAEQPEPVCYINWNEGEPNDYNFGEDYAIIFGNGSGLCNDYSNYIEDLPFFICEQIIGDGDGDGNIDAQDLTILVKSLLSDTECSEVLDANGDGVLNIVDLIRLRKHLANGTPLGKEEHPWSDWSEDNSLKDNSLYEVESKIQYAYSEKATTTSDSSSLSGWNYDYSTWTWGSYGSWSGWSTSSVSSDDYTDVDTSTLYKWYGFVCPYCGAHDPYNSGNCSGCNADKSTLQYTEFWSTDSWYNYTSYATRSTGTYRTKYTTSTNRYERWFSEWNTAPTTGYRYRTRNKIYTYHFYKWSEYSDWSDTAYTASDTRQVKTRTLYRYKLK